MERRQIEGDGSLPGALLLDLSVDMEIFPGIETWWRQDTQVSLTQDMELQLEALAHGYFARHGLGSHRKTADCIDEPWWLPPSRQGQNLQCEGLSLQRYVAAIFCYPTIDEVVLEARGEGEAQPRPFDHQLPDMVRQPCRLDLEDRKATTPSNCIIELKHIDHLSVERAAPAITRTGKI